MTRRFSIAEVAADAGVSATTVSHALSGKRAVSETTRARILASIERLDYRPNLVAASLRRQRTHTVALLVVDITNPYYPAVARAAQTVLAEQDYVPFIVNTDGEAAVERSCLREMVARNVDGVIMQPLALSVAEVRDIVGHRMPLVVTVPEEAVGAADLVVADSRIGIVDAVRYMADQGIEDIGFLSGPEGSVPGVTRLRVFTEAMGAHGLDVPERRVEHASAYTRDGGFVAASRMLEGRARPRAVLCANDLIAIGAMDAARLARLSIPGDLAIIGFDNIDTADLVSPRLTTVDNPAAAVGTACAQRLLERITSGPQAPYTSTTLPTRLLVRASA